MTTGSDGHVTIRVIHPDSGSEPELWRSALYPADWTPGYETAEGQLRDFSTVGYRAGDMALPVADLADAIDVLDHGADPTGNESLSLEALRTLST